MSLNGGTSSSGSCIDTDIGVVDYTGDSCVDYSVSWCGNYNDDDFDSNLMCCVCGGGNSGPIEDTLIEGYLN